MAQPATSAITLAFAASSSSPAMAARVGSKPATFFAASANRPAGFPPTPPNSLSPNLPAQADRRGLLSPPPMQIGEDADLQDVGHTTGQGSSSPGPMPLSKGALSGLESAQAITPSMLAKDYLPPIMLGHGPVAIKHVLGCLTHSVPGFSRIAPAKARRLVVAALESRAGGGQDGSVEFEKVGWGRWDAHVKAGQSYGRASSAYPDDKASPPPSEPSSYAFSHADFTYPINKRKSAQANEMRGHSWTGSSMPSHDEALEYMSMSENEADNMSLDGSESNDDDNMSDSGDETEPEDWAAMGADALRKSSIPTAAAGSVRRNYNLLCVPGAVYDRRLSHSGGVRKPSQSVLAKSAPDRHGLSFPSSSSRSGSNAVGRSPTNVFNNNTSDVHMGDDQTPQERDAIRALLSLGSL